MTAARSRAWTAAAAVATAVGVLGAFRTLPTPDVSWLLFASGRLLDGARLGVDVVENSPPVILWFKLPAVMLSRAAGWDSWFVWVAAVALLGVVSLLASHRVIRRVPSVSGSAGLLTAVLAIGLFLLPQEDFGQREHVAICLAMPWLLALGARFESAELPRGLSWGVALAGGLGLSVKPHFGLVWLAVAAVALWRWRTLKTLLLPDLAGAALVPALAIVATLVFHPEWLGYARIYGPLYQGFGRENPLWVGLAGEGVEWSWLGILALLAFAPVIRPLPGALVVFAAALGGFHAAAAVQMKGWGYHFIPAGVIGLALATAAVSAGAVGPWGTDRLARRVYRLAVPVGIAVAAWAGVRRAAHLMARPDARWLEADPSLTALLARLRHSGRQETLLVASTNIGAGFPLTYLLGAGWTMRHPSLWLLGSVYEQELRRPGIVLNRPPHAWTEGERRMMAELEEDASNRPPTVVMMPQPMRDAPLWAASQRFRYMRYLEAIPRLRAAGCFESPPAAVGAYLVWTCQRS